MAQKYQNYFVTQHQIMVDAFLLMTCKKNGEELNTQTLSSGKIELVGQFLQENHAVEFFPQDWKKIYLKSAMYNHFIFKSAEDWGLVGFIYVHQNFQTTPYNGDLEDFFVEDYHYWICLQSPIKRNYVHKACLSQLSIAKIKGTNEMVVGSIYERPKRSRQAPQTYEIIDPIFSHSGNFVSDKLDLSSVQLEWATPVLTALVNSQASGLGIVEEEDIIREFD